jgi:rSAM/selenodomain-associated transferase 1
VATRHLILFVKAPRLGAVKTRLARDIGRYEAWRFHRDTTRLMLRRLSGGKSWRTWLAVTPDEFAARAGFWPSSIPRLPQGHGTIGTRMAHAFAAMPPGPSVLIGADIPTVARRHIAAAFRHLGHADVVFGPSTDGGYWLVGMRHAGLARVLFKSVRWSSPHALADTLANAKTRKITLLDPLTDIDTGTDHKRWKETGLSPSNAPAAAA